MSTPLYGAVIAGRDVRIVATDRSDGDVHPDRVCAEVLLDRQVRATGRRWAMLDEVHGLGVVDVDAAVPAEASPTVVPPADVPPADQRRRSSASNSSSRRLIRICGA